MAKAVGTADPSITNLVNQDIICSHGALRGQSSGEGCGKTWGRRASGSTRAPLRLVSCGTLGRRGRCWRPYELRGSGVWEWEEPSRRTGERRRTERRVGQGHPRMSVPSSFSFFPWCAYTLFLGMRVEVSYFFSFVFPTGGWGPDYDRLGRYWCQGKGYVI